MDKRPSTKHDACRARQVATLRDRPSVVDQDSQVTGMVLLWLDDVGYIECLEYAWFTDEMPTQLPDPHSLVLRPG